MVCRESFKLPLSSSGVSREEFVRPLCHLSVGDQHSVFGRGRILGSRGSVDIATIAFTGDIVPGDTESFKLPLSSSGVSSEEFVQPLCHLSVGDQHSVFSRNCILGSQGSADSLPAITFIGDIIPSDL
ncbi:hypothetical protein Droror1_Dr00000005 [Drosera rotundifolia]